jgi:hypothetical protein
VGRPGSRASGTRRTPRCKTHLREFEQPYQLVVKRVASRSHSKLVSSACSSGETPEDQSPRRARHPLWAETHSPRAMECRGWRRPTVGFGGDPLRHNITAFSSGQSCTRPMVSCFFTVRSRRPFCGGCRRSNLDGAGAARQSRSAWTKVCSRVEGTRPVLYGR